MRQKIFYLILSIVTLPIVVFVTLSLQKIITRALSKPARIVIDTQDLLTPVNLVWNNFAQGGEEPPPMLLNTVALMNQLKPNYIRVDHIFDYYHIVKKTNQGFTYDFTKLDETVEAILAMGALPFFSLSYMPPEFTNSGSVVDLPNNWLDWQNLVQATVEHYSAINNKNLFNVYYEVWNEPELAQFGGWKLNGGKDYRLLYYYSQLGAQKARNVNRFFIGGPAVGSYYPNWINHLITYVVQNKLRLDFYSFHRYHHSATQFTTDAIKTRKLLSNFPDYQNLPLVLSEWGIESDNNPINESYVSSAFTVAAVSKFYSHYQGAYSFEVKDGPPPSGGKWGLITHEKANQSLSAKPKYSAFQQLSRLTGNNLHVQGQGTYVVGIASKNNKETRVVLANYDEQRQNTENVPLTFTGLYPAAYTLTYEYFPDKISGSLELLSTDGKIQKSFIMAANSILSISLIASAQLATFIPGASLSGQDRALVLQNLTEPFTLNQEIDTSDGISFSFDIKPFWQEDNNETFLILNISTIAKSGQIQKIFLSKGQQDNKNILILGISGLSQTKPLFLPIDNWLKDSWHHVEFGWNTQSLFLILDRSLQQSNQILIDIAKIGQTSLYKVEAAIDNLRVSSGNQIIVQRRFNDSTDR